MPESSSFVWKDRLRASAIHFCISAAIALLAALLVFLVWYPDPYREISGGRELFLILVCVDVVLGPLITLAIFNRAKPWRVLRRDLAVVGLIQLAALGYGIWTVYLARPVHLVFEFDRFRVVHSIEVPMEMLDQTPAGVEALPLNGPTVLAVRPFRNNDERMDATLAALGGVHLSARPDLWQAYADARPRVLEVAKPVSELSARFPESVAQIDKAIARTGRPPDSLLSLPVVGRSSTWTVLLDASTTDVVGFLPLDSF
jgi:hypothetical protein